LLILISGIALGVFSYNGEVTITLLANETVIPTFEMNNRILNEYLQEEMHGLQKHEPKDIV
jgi:hypothetical protein